MPLRIAWVPGIRYTHAPHAERGTRHIGARAMAVFTPGDCRVALAFLLFPSSSASLLIFYLLILTAEGVSLEGVTELEG
jgi:hypothetical protein